MILKPKSVKHGFVVILDCTEGVLRIKQRIRFDQRMLEGHDWMALKPGVSLRIEVER
jgi:hypothetical protein